MARQRKGRRNGGNDKTDAKPTVSPSAVTSSRGGNDDDDYMVVDYAGRHGVCYNLFQFVTNMVMYHYLMWWIPMVGFLYLLHLWGPLGDLLAAVCLLIYLPSFFSRAPFVKGRPWPWLRRLPFWNVMQNYLSIRLVRTKKLDPDDQYVFGFHPHGILVLSRVATYGGAFERLFPGIDFRVLGATPMFYFPGCREICLWMGAVDAGKATANRILDDPSLNIIVYPGGSKEIFSTDPSSKETRLTLKKRFGFVKLAIAKGAQLVPVFVFGEKHLYSRLRLPAFIRNFCLKRLRMPMILFWGRWFTCVPKSRPLSVVFGEPLETPFDPEPSKELVAKVHAEYVAAVEKLFNDHKESQGYGPDETLVIT